jgi:multimeric flavodoxin WrbA
MALAAFAFNCSLKPSVSKSPSSTDRLLREIADELKACGASMTTVRAADHDIKPGVTSDEGDGDAWPELRKQILAADILVMGTPIWLGQPSSIAKRVLERMDAFLGETDAAGRMPSFGKVAIIAVVGNEDGAHHVTAELAQALNDVGFTLAASAATYWVGEAMHKTNYVDLDATPDTTASTTRMAVRNAVHLAELLKGAAYPGSSD